MDFDSVYESIERQIEIEFSKLIQVIMERKENLLKQLSQYRKGINKSKLRLDEKRAQLQSNLSKDDQPLHNEVSEIVNKFNMDVEKKLSELSENEANLGVSVAFVLENELLEHQLRNIGVLTYEALYSQPDSIVPLANNPLYMTTDKKDHQVYLVTAHNDGVILDKDMQVLSVQPLPKPPPDIKARNFGGIACNKDFLYLSLMNENKIAVFSKTWKFTHTFGEQGAGQNQLSGPQGLCYSEGKLYVCESTNSRVQIFKNGKHAGFLGQASKPGRVYLPNDICTNRRDEILVLHKGNPCVNMYSLSGDLLRQFGSYLSGMGAEFLGGLCVTKDNHILITSWSKNRVYLYTEDATSCIVIGGKNGKSSNEPGMFNIPMGMSMTPQGCVAVCDHNNARIQLFQPDMVQSLFY